MCVDEFSPHTHTLLIRRLRNRTRMWAALAWVLAAVVIYAVWCIVPARVAPWRAAPRQNKQPALPHRGRTCVVLGSGAPWHVKITSLVVTSLVVTSLVVTSLLTLVCVGWVVVLWVGDDVGVGVGDVGWRAGGHTAEMISLLRALRVTKAGSPYSHVQFVHASSDVTSAPRVRAAGVRCCGGAACCYLLPLLFRLLLLAHDTR